MDEKNGYVYSCDMVRFSVDIRKDCAEKFASRFCADVRLDVKMFPPSFVPFRYRQLINVTVGESTVSMGVGFNGFGASDERLRGFIEFNPNKCFPEWRDEFLDVCGWCSRIEVMRLDLAVDVPMERSACALVKDTRLYSYEQHSDVEYSEFLGKRNVCGRVKLYNKAVEQKLSYPLTRLEITTECDLTEFKKHIPQVVLSGTQQIDFEHADLSELSQNDRVTVQLLNTLDFKTRMTWLRKYTYRHRQKIEKYVMSENRLRLNMRLVSEVFMDVQKYSGLSA